MSLTVAAIAAAAAGFAAHRVEASLRAGLKRRIADLVAADPAYRAALSESSDVTVVIARRGWRDAARQAFVFSTGASLSDATTAAILDAARRSPTWRRQLVLIRTEPMRSATLRAALKGRRGVGP